MCASSVDVTGNNRTAKIGIIGRDGKAGNDVTSEVTNISKDYSQVKVNYKDGNSAHLLVKVDEKTTTTYFLPSDEKARIQELEKIKKDKSTTLIAANTVSVVDAQTNNRQPSNSTENNTTTNVVNRKISNARPENKNTSQTYDFTTEEGKQKFTSFMHGKGANKFLRAEEFLTQEEIGKLGSKNKLEEALQSTGNYIRVIQTKEKTAAGQPIIQVNFYDGGSNEIIAKIKAVSGRPHTQTLDRNTPGNDAPLPDGVYNIKPEDFTFQTNLTGRKREQLGKRGFLPFNPEDKGIERSALGFHTDPTANIINDKEAGTSGCIGFLNDSDTEFALKLIAGLKIKKLEVDIERTRVKPNKN
jgi:hypothetical protein